MREVFLLNDVINYNTLKYLQGLGCYFETFPGITFMCQHFMSEILGCLL